MLFLHCSIFNEMKAFSFLPRFVALAAVVASAMPGGAFTVIDSLDRLPVAAAAVYNSRGAMLGITDDAGGFAASVCDYPLSVQCLGYEIATVLSPQDTVALTTRFYNLPETEVSSVPKDGVKVTFFVREYNTMIVDGDTTMVLRECMADVILPNRPKVKGFKGHNSMRVRNSRNYARYFLRNGTDSVARNVKYESLLSVAHCDTLLLAEPERLRGINAGVDSVMKKDTKVVFRKNGAGFFVMRDALAGKEGHRYSPNALKLFGLTMDFTELFVSSSFRLNGDYRYRLPDMQQRSVVISALARGKMWKKMLNARGDIGIHATIDIYPVDFEYLTVEECRSLEKEDRGSIEWRIPEWVAPLSPLQSSLVARSLALPPQ